MRRKERAAIKMLKCTTLSVLPPTRGMSTHTNPCVSSSDNKNDRNSPFPSPLSSTSPVPLPSSHSIMYRAARIKDFSFLESDVSSNQDENSAQRSSFFFSFFFNLFLWSWQNDCFIVITFRYPDHFLKIQVNLEVKIPLKNKTENAICWDLLSRCFS